MVVVFITSRMDQGWIFFQTRLFNVPCDTQSLTFSVAGASLRPSSGHFFRCGGSQCGQDSDEPQMGHG